jgi:asparagine synthetase B (glutamine-hydrolysing)
VCGILLTTRGIEDLPTIIEFLKFRGPDQTNTVSINGLNFVHTLLSMTGPPTPQPFVSPDHSKIAFFNGEIYNFQEFGEFDSDGECILPLYQEFGIDFVKKLDGEFALALVDFHSDTLLFSTDVFSMKPLWFAMEEIDWGLSSYKSCLERVGFSNPVQIEANSTYIFELSTMKKLSRMNVYEFDLNQHKESFDDWNAAFSQAIDKRTRNIKHGIFIGLSSGYDSGAIACELEAQGIPFTAYSIVGSENEETIRTRIERTTDPRLIELDRDSFLIARGHLKGCCEEYTLRIDNGEADLLDTEIERYTETCLELDKLEPIYRELNDPEVTDRVRILRNDKALLEKRIPKLREMVEYRKSEQILTDDNGAIGMSHICRKGKSEGQLIYLSGSGADEVISDYGFGGIKHFRHSTIGGHFPDDLELVFPWKNFYDNTQRAYLMKEEHVSGSYGVEGRYPFLDTMVVQEFLWLSPKLKNSNYKSVIHNFLTEHDYPFDDSQKVGFNCGFSPVTDGFNIQKSKFRRVGETSDSSLIVNIELEASRTNKRRERNIL